mgnify:CR=1 FL=1
MGQFSHIYRTARWKKVRTYVIGRAHGLCEGCKRRGVMRPGREVDHIEELTEENCTVDAIVYNPKNLQLLCTDCHNEKHDRSIGIQRFLSPPGG